MHVYLRRACAAALLATAGGLLAAACVPNESTIFFRGCMIPTESAGLCSVQAEVSAPVWFSGAIDSAFTSEYHCLALLENQMVARGDPTSLRTETARVDFYQADVQILTADPPEQAKIIQRLDGSLAQYSVAIKGFADPGTGTTPGLGSADVVMIDAATVKDLRLQAIKSGRVQSVVSSVTVRGRSLGGLELYTNTFRWPIDVYVGDTCVEPVSDTCTGSNGKPTAVCYPGQDLALDCRLLNPCQHLICLENSEGELVGHCAPYGVGDGSCCGQ